MHSALQVGLSLGPSAASPSDERLPPFYTRDREKLFEAGDGLVIQEVMGWDVGESTGRPTIFGPPQDMHRDGALIWRLFARERWRLVLNELPYLETSQIIKLTGAVLLVLIEAGVASLQPTSGNLTKGQV